ncbi:hypothetical protein BC332_07775 [Capsicum chinense]|nr:hypothetical protein BC332_07775 [Capsicum chinense]
MLRFFINEFALITGLNCFENVDDFKYEDSSTSRLMKRYFPQSTNGVDKEALVERFLKENFENKEKALQMAILYFIHTFIYLQLNASPAPFSDFKMVENEKYQFFPLGKMSFSRLMALLRQEFSMEKQLYRLGGIPQCLYANIVSTADEFEKLDLARTSFASDPMIDQKFKDLESLMNARFNEVLNSLQQKNESVKQETIVKQSRRECDPSDAVVDDARPTDSVGKETDNSVEMEDDKANQAPSFLKKSEQHEKEVGIEKQSDIVVEEIQPLESIIPAPKQTGAHQKQLDILAPTCAVYELRKDNDDHYKVNCSTLGFRQLNFVVAFPKSKNWKDNDDHYKVNCSTLGFRQLNFVVAFPKSKNWFYLMYQQNKCWNNEDASVRTDEVADMEMNCGIFMVVYAEYLSEGLGIPCSGIDAQYHRLRYVSLLCKYGSEKAENRYFSENDDPPRPRSKFALKEINRDLHIK